MEIKILDKNEQQSIYTEAYALLQAADSEFVPPLSCRDSSVQTDFSSESKGDGITRYFEQLKNQRFIAAFEKGALIAFVSYRENYACDVIGETELPNVYISTLVVNPAYRGRGVTTALYNELFSHYSSSDIFTRTWSTNVAHIKILQKFGFDCIKTIKNDRGDGIDTVYFKKAGKSRLDGQLEFALEIDKVKNVFRQTHLSGHGRNENDAEHSWHMAVMAYLLREYANEDVDISKVMLMCLIHDIVEIDAGDTYAYDSENLKTQKAREDAAKERIFSILPKEQAEEFTALFDEFEEYETAESKFAHAMDNLQPLILNNSNGGSDWKEHGVSAEQVYSRQTKTALGSKKLFEVTDGIIQKHIERGNLKKQS